MTPHATEKLSLYTAKTEPRHPRAQHSTARGATKAGSPTTQLEHRPCSLQVERVCRQQRRPRAAKRNKIIFKQKPLQVQWLSMAPVTPAQCSQHTGSLQDSPGVYRNPLHLWRPSVSINHVSPPLCCAVSPLSSAQNCFWWCHSLGRGVILVNHLRINISPAILFLYSLKGVP